MNIVTASTVETSLETLLQAIASMAPKLAPAIFLTSCTPRSLEDLCATETQVERLKKWRASQSASSSSSSSSSSSLSSSSQCAFATDVNFVQRTIRITKIIPVSDLDATLISLEKTMRMMIMGGEDELNVAITRFLQANGYTGNIAEERHIFNEVYNAAYAAKVLLSNTPCMKVTLEGYVVPLEDNVPIGRLLSNVLAHTRDEDDEEEEDGGDEDEDDYSSSKGKASADLKEGGGEKKRKRKRGGKKG